MPRAAASLAPTAACVAIIVGVVTAAAGGGGTCGLNATTANFSAVVAGASAGQTVCLASGDYGTWAGTNKVIAVAAAPGASPAMAVDFASGANGFTLYGISGMSGSIDSGARNITIEHSTFTDTLVITNLSNANVTLNGDTFEPQQDNSNCTAEPADLHLAYRNGTTPSGVTVENSTFISSAAQGNNPKQGIQTGASMVIRDNVFNGFENLTGCNHIDSVQLYGGENVTVVGNLFENDYDGLAAFEGTSSNTITDNACINLERGSCITLYSDTDSVVEHNTAAGAGYSGQEQMNVVELDHKPADPAGTGTVVENNVGSIGVSDGSTMAVDTNNLYQGAVAPDINGTPTFVGGSTPTTWAGFELTSSSPGHLAATDGTDVGIRASAGSPPAG